MNFSEKIMGIHQNAEGKGGILEKAMAQEVIDPMVAISQSMNGIMLIIGGLFGLIILAKIAFHHHYYG